MNSRRGLRAVDDSTVNIVRSNIVISSNNSTSIVVVVGLY